MLRRFIDGLSLNSAQKTKLEGTINTIYCTHLIIQPNITKDIGFLVSYKQELFGPHSCYSLSLATAGWVCSTILCFVDRCRKISTTYKKIQNAENQI